MMTTTTTMAVPSLDHVRVEVDAAVDVGVVVVAVVVAVVGVCVGYGHVVMVD